MSIVSKIPLNWLMRPGSRFSAFGRWCKALVDKGLGRRPRAEPLNHLYSTTKTATVLPSPVDSEREELPKTFGPFKILELIHRSNMSIVYKAQQENPSKTVALKLPLGQADHKRIKYEAQVADEAFALGIVPVLWAGEVEGVPCYTMPFIEGDSFLAHARTKNLSVLQRVRLFEKVCERVEKLHAREQPLVHLDLKPGNVVVDRNGDVWLLDFGLSRSLAKKGGKVEGGGGTPAYMAPEQTCSDKSKGPSADVYALGVILYELLTDKLPYDLAGQDHEQMANTIREFLPLPPSARKRDGPRQFDNLIMRCLSKDPEGRPQSAGELLRSLQKVLIAPEPEIAPEARRVRWLRPAMAGVLILAAVAGGYLLLTQAKWEPIAHDGGETNVRTERAAMTGGNAGNAPLPPPSLTLTAASSTTDEPRTNAVAERTKAEKGLGVPAELATVGLTGLTMQASSAVVSPPYVLTNGTIRQPMPKDTDQGGRVIFHFMVSTPGLYLVQASVNAPEASAFYVNIDAEPQDPMDIWDVRVTSGFESRVVSWRGNGTPENPQFSPKQFRLALGPHELVIAGRGANSELQSVSMLPLPAEPVNMHIVPGGP